MGVWSSIQVLYEFVTGGKLLLFLWWPGCVIPHLILVALIYFVNRPPQTTPISGGLDCHWEELHVILGIDTRGNQSNQLADDGGG